MSSEVLAYTVADAARVSGVGRTKLYELLGRGELKAVKAGGKTLVPADSLKAYLAGLPAADIRTGQPRAAA